MKFFLSIFILFASLILSWSSNADDCVVATEISGVITAATNDYLERAENFAVENDCSSLLLRMNTPGGDLQSTRMIVERMLASQVPYLCLVTPQGAHAGSAGAIMMMACHLSGGLPATNLGAATPILGNGQELPEDLRKKIINDTVSWIEGVAKMRGRNLDFAKEIVTEAKSASIEDAVKIKAVDIFAKDELDFLAQAKGKKIGENNLEIGEIIEFKPDLRSKILGMVADPEIAYILFMASLALIYFEVTHPGVIAPGVLGGMGLVLSLVALHKLEVQWGGLALIVLGIGFLIAELFVTSFGILGIGGIASLVMGSLFLFDTETTGYALPLGLILGVAFALGTVFLGVGFLILKSMRRKRKSADGVTDQQGRVTFVDDSHRGGQIEISGEIWKFESDENIGVGDRVLVLRRHGLTLKVKKIQ